MSMLAKVLTNNEEMPITQASLAMELHIEDKSSHTVMIGNRLVRIAPQPFNILLYLYENANKVVTSRELVEKALASKYDKEYLHTLIGRIRMKIEDNPDEPRYLITEHSIGYRLITKP